MDSISDNGLSRSDISTSRHLAISTNVATFGCALLVHHLETVAGSFPIFSASHLLVLFFSTKTTLMRFKSSLIAFKIYFKRKDSDFIGDKKRNLFKYFRHFFCGDSYNVYICDMKTCKMMSCGYTKHRVL